MYEGGGTTTECWEYRADDSNDGSANDGDGGLGKWTQSSFSLIIQRAETGYVKMDNDRLWITGVKFKPT